MISLTASTPAARDNIHCAVKEGDKVDTARVSMIILVYQKLDNLHAAVDSVLGQDYLDVELIISDDCSPHFPLEELRQYIEENKRENVKRVVMQTMPENLGTVRHANAAAAQATGQYVRFLGGDDELHDCRVITDTVAFMQQTGALVSTSLTAAYDEQLNRLLYTFPSEHEARQMNSLAPEKLFGELAVSGNIVGAPGVTFRREFFEQGGFDCTYRLTEDFPTWLRLFREKTSIPCMQRVTVKYRTNGISSHLNKNLPVGRLLFSELGKVYEKEILAYSSLLTPFQRRYSEFVYYRIRHFDGFSLHKKLIFFLQYTDIILWRKYSTFMTNTKRIFNGTATGFRNRTLL